MEILTWKRSGDAPADGGALLQVVDFTAAHKSGCHLFDVGQGALGVLGGGTQGEHLIATGGCDGWRRWGSERWVAKGENKKARAKKEFRAPIGMAVLLLEPDVATSMRRCNSNSSVSNSNSRMRSTVPGFVDNT